QIRSAQELSSRRPSRRMSASTSTTRCAIRPKAHCLVTAANTCTPRSFTDSDMRKIAALAIASLVLANISPARAQARLPMPSERPPARAPSLAPDTEYPVGPRGGRKITAFDEPTLTGSYRVDGDGSFQYPMLGRVQAGGKKLRDI